MEQVLLEPISGHMQEEEDCWEQWAWFYWTWIIPDPPDCLLCSKDCICGWGESSGCHLPQSQQGFPHHLPQWSSFKARTMNGWTIWLQKSWLDSWVKKVVVNRTYTACRPVTSGVMQGSLLGSVLFDIFISDMEEVTDSSGLKFADGARLQRHTVGSGLPSRGT